MSGILYGVGVGPGDPELMTLKAVRLIQENEIIACPGTMPTETTAYRIASQAVPELAEKTLLPVAMPMVMDREKMRENHEKAADQMEPYLQQGENIVFLTLGDPAIYSTFYYIQEILAKRGYTTELVSGIPSFRLEKDVVEAEIDVLRQLGVEIRCGVEVGKDVTIPQLRKQGYKGFYVAIGAQKSSKLNIPGEELEGVQGGIDFLRKVNQNQESGIGKKVAVIGGGNVAMDVCRTAVRLGAEEVSIVYRRTAEEMPADKEEVREAEAEGVVFRYLNAPVEILGQDGRVCGLKVERMALGEPDEKGRRKPVGTGEFDVLDVDTVLGAIGQTADWGTLLEGSKVVLGKKGCAEADSWTYQTAEPDIFVGGDIYTGPKFVIDAIAAGKEGADSLHRFVHEGHSLTLGRVRRDNFKYIDKSNVLIPLSGYDSARRNTHGVDESKVKTFRDERLPFTEEQVKAEAARCLKCGAAWVDSNICIGCGLCTTRCKFDAIHLHKEYDAWGVPYEKLVGHVLKMNAQRVGRRLVKKDI